MDPSIIAAIISSMLPKQGGAAPLPQGAGMDMNPVVKPELFGEGGRDAANKNLGRLTGDETVAKVQGIMGSMTPESKMNEAVQKADAGKNAGVMEGLKSDALTQGTSMLENVEASKQMGFDEKMQMAALVAQLGSALHGPGAPPPPGAPRGGGIGMSPVFQQMTARNIYG